MNREFSENRHLKREYLDNVTFRLSMASLELEGEDGDLSTPEQTMKIWNQKSALFYVLNNKSLIYNHYDFLSHICEINSRLTGGEIENFRTTSAQVMGSSIERTPAMYIRQELLYLVDDHNYHLKQFFMEKDVKQFFYNEAMFHMKFLHIHPFEDGNGRTARVLLFKHLFLNGFAPAVITREVKKKYCDLIENKDVQGLADLFYELSNVEQKNMQLLYDRVMQEQQGDIRGRK